MLKGTLATHLLLIFLRLLCSVAGNEGDFAYDSLPYFTPTFKEMCLDRFDPLFCQNWDPMRFRINHFKPERTFKPKETFEINSYESKEIPEGNSQEEIALEIPATNNLQKRFTVFRRKAPTARGYKRGPGFRSWGGKRDFTSNLDKKTKFAAWGGKRDNEAFPDDLIISNVFDKKSKFQNWGGKRDENDMSGLSGQAEKREPIFKTRGFFFSEPFKKHVPKRPQFQSWGGKRASYSWDDFLGFLYPQPRYLLNGGEKRKFSSWGGKRYDESEQQQEEHVNGENDIKRHVFRNWGGKRDTSDEESNQNESQIGETRSKRDVNANNQAELKKGKSKSR